MFIDTKYRSTDPEIMDDFSMDGELLRRTLDRLAWINKWLGGNRVTLDGLKALLRPVPQDRQLTVVDLGCGSGAMLREVAKFARRAGRRLRLIGVDANAFTVDYARKRSKNYPEIRYLCQRAPSAEFSNLQYDILLSTLFLHHFRQEEIPGLLEEIIRNAQVGIVINDLHRSRRAYFLFKLLTIFIPNPLVRRDGLTSILRGFKRKELLDLAKRLDLKNSRIRWRWAFRYQWTIRCERKQNLW